MNYILFHLKTKILNFLSTIKISYFLFFRYVKISRSTSSIKGERQVFQFVLFFHFTIYWNAYASTCLATIWLWRFHLISITTQDWTGLWVLAANLTDQQKGKKKSRGNWLLEVVLQKSFSKNFTEFTEKYLC